MNVSDKSNELCSTSGSYRSVVQNCQVANKGTTEVSDNSASDGMTEWSICSKALCDRAKVTSVFMMVFVYKQRSMNVPFTSNAETSNACAAYRQSLWEAGIHYFASKYLWFLVREIVGGMTRFGST